MEKKCGVVNCEPAYIMIRVVLRGDESMAIPFWVSVINLNNGYGTVKYGIINSTQAMRLLAF